MVAVDKMLSARRDG